MSIRRFDHRARFRAKYLNDVIDQVNLLNKAEFTLTGGSGNISLGGSVEFHQTFSEADVITYCPPFFQHRSDGDRGLFDSIKRRAVYTWGVTLTDVRAQAEVAAAIRYNARGGVYDSTFESDGWGGFDVTNVQCSDLITDGAGYIYDSEEDHGYNTGDALAAYDATTNPFPGYEAAGFTAYTFETWPHNDIETCNDAEGAIWETLPLFGIKWGLKVSSGGVATVYPTNPSSSRGGAFVTAELGSASFGAQAVSTGFDHLFKSIPEGAVIVSAKIPVKLAGLSISTTTATEAPELVTPEVGVPYWDGHTTSTSSTDPGGSIGFVLMARHRNGTYVDKITGRTMRSTQWSVLGNVDAGTATADEWAVIDITDLVNNFVTTIRTDHENFEFALFPSPYVGLLGSSDLKGWLASIAVLPEYEMALNPGWGPEDRFADGHIGPASDAKNHGFWTYSEQNGTGDYGPYIPAYTTRHVTWDTIEFGVGVAEWTYPSSAIGHVTTTNIVRGDSPAVV